MGEGETPVVTESLLRRLLENKSAGFALGLGSIVALVLNKSIDSSAFATCFSALIVAFMGALAWGK